MSRVCKCENQMDELFETDEVSEYFCEACGRLCITSPEQADAWYIPEDSDTSRVIEGVKIGPDVEALLNRTIKNADDSIILSDWDSINRCHYICVNMDKPDRSIKVIPVVYEESKLVLRG